MDNKDVEEEGADPLGDDNEIEGWGTGSSTEEGELIKYKVLLAAFRVADRVITCSDKALIRLTASGSQPLTHCSPAPDETA